MISIVRLGVMKITSRFNHSATQQGYQQEGNNRRKCLKHTPTQRMVFIIVFKRFINRLVDHFIAAFFCVTVYGIHVFIFLFPSF